MTHVINSACIDVKDKACVDVCPVDCIHGTEEDPQLYIHPEDWSTARCASKSARSPRSTPRKTCRRIKSRTPRSTRITSLRNRTANSLPLQKRLRKD